MRKTRFSFVIVLCIAVSVAGFSFLIFQQEKILRKYFIIDPHKKMDVYKTSLSHSLSKYFIKENGGSSLGQVADYIKKYGRTSLFELIFVFKDADGSMRQVSKDGISAVTGEVLAGEDIYSLTVDNGAVEGYLLVIIKEAGESELREGLRKYNTISYSLWFLFFLLIAALSVIAFYHNYSAKIRLARDMAEIKASNDGLTGLHTHEYFMKALEIEVEKFRIYHTPVALMMLDIDHFKDFNDTFGHPAGDKVLEDVAKIMKMSTRATDIPARYGGEEFVVIIPHIVLRGEKRNKENLKEFVNEIKNFSERIRKNIEDYRSPSLQGQVRITISIGVSFYYNRAASATAAALLQKADMALYRAKRLGRNRVYIDYESAQSL